MGVQRDVLVVRGENPQAPIATVDNRAPAWRDSPGWTIAPEPVLTIGSLEGPSEYQIFRVSAALRLSDGCIAVTNVGSSEIRFLDPAGEFVSAAGSQGQGPEEFLAISGMWVFGAVSLTVFDYQNGRLVVIGQDGGFRRTFRLEVLGERFAWPEDLLSDSLLLAAGSRVEAEAEGRRGLRRDSSVYSLRTMTGALVDSLGGVRWIRGIRRNELGRESSRRQRAARETSQGGGIWRSLALWIE